jgi:hypothetical protein
MSIRQQFSIENKTSITLMASKAEENVYHVTIISPTYPSFRQIFEKADCIRICNISTFRVIYLQQKIPLRRKISALLFTGKYSKLVLLIRLRPLVSSPFISRRAFACSLILTKASCKHSIEN